MQKNINKYNKNMKNIEREMSWISKKRERFIKIHHSIDKTEKELYTDGYISLSLKYNEVENISKYVLKKWDFIIEEYDYIWEIILLENWDEVFFAKIWNKSMYVRLKSGKNIWWEFDEVGNIQKWFDGNEYFLAKKSEKEIYVSFLSRISVWWEFDEVGDIYNVWNTMKVFQVKKWGKSSYINLSNGKIIWWSFDYVWSIKQQAGKYIFRVIQWKKMMYIDFYTEQNIWWEFDKIWRKFITDSTGIVYFEWIVWDKKLKINILNGENIDTVGNKIMKILQTKIL